MTEEAQNLKLIISKLKTQYSLTQARSKDIHLDQFSFTTQGGLSKINYKWKVEDFTNPVYIISVDKSYQLNIVSPSLNKDRHLGYYNYLFCYIELNVTFQNFIIRPNSLGDKVVSFFKHSNKINDHQKFNDLYILASNSTKSLTSVLTNDLINAIETTKELHLEVIDNKCLMQFSRPADLNDTIRLFEVAKQLLRLDQNAE